MKTRGPAAPSHRFFERFAPDPLIIAHRGFRACYPENTLCAFEQSLGRSRMIELDVQLSRDGVAVVFHDPELSRTSDGPRVAKQLGLNSLYLGNWELAQLRLLDLGSWFLAVDPFATLRQGMVDRAALAALMPQRILTLEEVLRWATAHRMVLNIEIKDMGGTPQDALIVPEVIRVIRATGTMEAVVISSFNHSYLHSCHQLAPEIAIAALQDVAPPSDLVAYLRSLGVCAFHPKDDLVDGSLVSTLRGAGLAVNVFTVNSPARQRQLFDLGVTGIFTDFLDPFSSRGG